ncbi:MAG: S-adenosylhomocysteine hydrolase [Alteromonadaceae bacterium]|nr:S-adenosylhomocysteine hydrolase [Alteromonadaceae bacterium]
MTIKSRIQTRIKRAKRSVFLRSDFKYIAGYDQIGRVLRNIVSDGELIKIGYGLYVRARVNRFTGNIMPDNPAGADGVLLEAIERLGANYQLDKLSQLYLQGKSTQIPAQVQIKTSKRFTRKIAIGTQ